MNSEELEELRIEGYLGIPGVSLDTMEKIRLFVVVWGEDNIVDDSLKYLAQLE